MIKTSDSFIVIFYIYNGEISVFVLYPEGGSLNPTLVVVVVVLVVSAYRYIATTTLAIIAVFVEYLGQFLIDFNQIYRHSSVPKNTSPAIFELFSSSGFRARRRRDFFCHFVRVTVYGIPRLPHTSIIWLN